MDTPDTYSNLHRARPTQPPREAKSDTQAGDIKTRVQNAKLNAGSQELAETRAQNPPHSFGQGNRCKVGAKAR